MMSQIAGVFSALLTVAIYAFAFEHVSLWQLSVREPWVWIAGLVLYDFCYYWVHRFGHTVALFWAAHVVHHQSEDYNLSTALRQTSSGWLGGWIFYLPMAVLGVPPLVFGVVALVDLLYQFWVHTQQIGKLGWFDRWFCAPQQPPRAPRRQRPVPRPQLRRHPDRLGPPVRQLPGRGRCRALRLRHARGPLRSWNPVWANLHNYADMAKDSWRARLGRQAAGLVQAPRLAPRRRGAALAEAGVRHPRVSSVSTRRCRAARRRWRSCCSLRCSGATTLFLWNAHRLTLAQQIAGGRRRSRRRCGAVGRSAARRNDRPGSVFSRKTALRGLQPGQE